LKHTRKHEKGMEESNQEAKLPASGGPSGQAGQTVRDGPHGPSGRVPRTVRTLAADCPASAADRPLKRTEPLVANLEKRTVRGEHADCPPGTRGPSALCCGLSETSHNQNSKPQRIKSEAEQEHEEHGTNSHVADCPPPTRGLSSPCGQS
jgi:hypothetical protein